MNCSATPHALCDFIVADEPDLPLFGRPMSIDYALSCVGFDEVLDEHRAGLTLWQTHPSARDLLLIWADERSYQGGTTR